MKKLTVLFLAMFTVAAWAIAPPKKGVQIPADMLSNIKSNPSYYMPSKGFVPQVERFKKQKELAKTQRTDDYTAPFLHASIPVLCGQYSDATLEWDAADMQNQLFGEWDTGSMRDYYNEISYGQFDLTGQVYGWYQVSGTFSYYERDNNHTGEFLLELFQASDDSVDYGQFDNDGPDGIPNSGDDDGYVDTIAIIHSGAGGEAGGPGIWSHSWSYQYYGNGPFVTNDASANGGSIRINDYIIQPAVSSGNMIEIGVFCHEFGHALGLPDLYDRDEEPAETSEGVGNWCLMAGGSYGGDGSSSYSPAHMCAWCKEVMGWIEPIMIEENEYNKLIPAVEDTDVVYKLWTKGEVEPYVYSSAQGGGGNIGKEYFLIENRQQKGFDGTLEGSGILVWHVDNTVFGQNDDEFHKLVDLESADGLFDLDYGRNRGDAGDIYPGTSNNRTFNRTSDPNSLDYDEAITKVAVSNISDPGDSMYADLEVNARDIAYITYTLDDATGDGNGFLDPGETGSLTFKLENYGETANNVTIVLSTDDPDITISDSTAIYPLILEDDAIESTNDMMTISASEDARVHPVKCRLSLTADNGYTNQFDIVIMMENIYILLVDDSRGEMDENLVRINEYYKNALDALDINYYDTWQVYTSGVPGQEVLAEYGTVIWLTGSQANTLNAEEQQALASFMDIGGDVFLVSQNAGFDLVEAGTEDSKTFYETYLHANYVQDVATDAPQKLMRGVSDEFISQDFTPYFFASEGDGANNNTSPDIIAPIDPASNVFEYFGTGLMGKSAGIKYEGDYKLVYLSFSFEAINEFGTDNVTRKEVMGNVIDWLQGAVSNVPVSVADNDAKIVSNYKLMQNYPNPFNPETTITFELAKPGKATIKIYNILGHEVATLTDTELQAGQHQTIWDGRDQYGNNAASGVYFYKLQSGSFNELRKMILVR